MSLYIFFSKKEVYIILDVYMYENICIRYSVIIGDLSLIYIYTHIYIILISSIIFNYIRLVNPVFL